MMSSGSIKSYLKLLALSAVPAIALAAFAPATWQACAVASVPSASVPVAVATVVNEPGASLTAWQETYNPTPMQINELNAFYKMQQIQYVKSYKQYTASFLASILHYRGHRLEQYLQLLYKNRELNNVNFTSYRHALVNGLYQGGFVPTTPYTFYTGM